MAVDVDEGATAAENRDLYMGFFERVGAGEKPFEGDLENENYKQILATFREIKFEWRFIDTIYLLTYFNQ